MMFIRSFAVSVAIILGAQTAVADGLYYGVGLGYSDSTSEPEFGGSSTADYATLGATLGYRWDRSAVFYTAELDVDVPLGEPDLEFDGSTCADGANGPYFCSHTITTRLRGLAGTTLSNGAEVFGSLGLATMTGDAAVSPFGDTDLGSAAGVTVGFGTQFVAGSGTVRVELIYDNMDQTVTMPNGNFEPKFEAVSVKASYLFN